MLLLVLGAVMLLAGLFGGGTKIFSVEIPIGFGGRVARIAAMALGLMLIGVGLYLTTAHPQQRAQTLIDQANADRNNSMPRTTSKSICLAIKAQWETQHSWSKNDDESLRQSFRGHGCQAHGLTIP
jgi:hypothetical protein